MARRFSTTRVIPVAGILLINSLLQGGVAIAAEVDDVSAASQLASTADKLGALGVYYDWASAQYVVVLPASGSSTFQLSAVASLKLTVRTEQRPIEKSEIINIEGVLASRSFSPAAQNASYGFHFDPQSGKVLISGDAPPGVFAPLESQFPGITRYEQASASRLRRVDDGPPHWGGAQLDLPGNIPQCTSGYTVKKANNTKYMVTAAHCFNLGGEVDGGAGAVWGTITDRGPFPAWDVELIGGGQYEGKIYTGNGVGTMTAVKAAADAAIGSTSYCTSGMMTFETCGHHVIGLNGTFCDASGCTSGLLVYQDGTAPVGGDSGAPFYNYPTSAGVTVRGIVIAKSGSTYYAERWVAMMNHFAISIVTS